MKNLYELELHEVTDVSCEIIAIRVPGGWIYRWLSKDTFVPYNNEFMPVIKTKEDETIELLKSISIRDMKLTSRANSAILSAYEETELKTSTVTAYDVYSLGRKRLLRGRNFGKHSLASVQGFFDSINVKLKYI